MITSIAPLENFLAGVVQLVLDESIFYPQYADRPVDFARDILGVEWTEAIQEIALSLLTNPKIAVPAGHAVGKTHGVAGVAIWWLSTRKTKVVTTAPTWRQVKDLIWRELRSQHRRAIKSLPGKPITTDWNLDEEDWFATGVSTNDPNRFQGYHADELLVILDEASGVDKEIWESIEDGLAVSEGNRILAIGNPTDPTGRFAQVCRSSEWKIFNLSCLDHPNVIEGKKIIKGAVTKHWVEQRIERWCVPYNPVGDEEDEPADVFEYQGQLYMPNDMFRVRILGQFPVEGGSQVFPLHHIWNAFNRERKEPEGAINIGLDVARFGDDLCVLTAGAENGVVLRIDPWQGARTTTSSGRVKHWVSEFTRRQQRVANIAVDEIGVGGGVVDDLAEGDYPVLAVNVARKPYDEEAYVNLRDELTFLFAEKMSHGEVDLTRVRSFEEMITEELASITFDYAPKGQRKVAPKSEIKDKIGRSPNFADSLILWSAFSEAGHIKAQALEKEPLWGAKTWADIR